MEYTVNEIAAVEILTLIDNYIDITAMDDTPVISRAGLTKKGNIRNSVLAEHGYSALIRTSTGDTIMTMLFDFGFSKGGVAFNARALGVDMRKVGVLALSHGHSDHTGGLGRLARMVGKCKGEGARYPVRVCTFRHHKYGKLCQEANKHR